MNFQCKNSISPSNFPMKSLFIILLNQKNYDETFDAKKKNSVDKAYEHKTLTHFTQEVTFSIELHVQIHFFLLINVIFVQMLNVDIAIVCELNYMSVSWGFI